MTKSTQKLTLFVTLLFSALTIHIFWLAKHYGYHSGDTMALAGNAAAALSCLKTGQAPCPGMGHFPIFQFVIMMALQLKHLPLEKALNTVVLFNAFCFLGTLLTSFALMYKRRSISIALLSSLILLSSPLLWYSKASFNESAAAFSILIFTTVSLQRMHWFWLTLSFIAAALTKEVALPFLVLIAVLAFWPDLSLRVKNTRMAIFGILVGIIVSVGLTVSFNFWRFHSLINETNLNPILLTPNLKQQASFFFGLLFSPNAGVTFFWTSFSLLLAFCVVKATRGLKRTSIENLLPGGGQLGFVLIVLAIFLGLVLGFSKWYAPFGWVAWGPRLMLPWLPSLMILLLDYFAIDLESALSWLAAKKARILLLAGVLGLFALPQYNINLTPEVFGKMFSPNPECPRPAIIQQEPEFYYQCMNKAIWPKHYLLLVDVLEAPMNPRSRVYSMLYLVMIFLLTFGASNLSRQQSKSP